MKTIIIVLLLLIEIVLVIPLQQVFAQVGASEQMMNHMRFTHSQLTNNIDQIKQLIQANNTSEALNLLDGMEIKIKGL